LPALRGSAGGPGDEGCVVGGAEAVIDVDDGDVGRAGVEHAEESCGSGEGGSIADGGGHGEDGDADQAADDRGEGSLHAGADDNRLGLEELVADGEEAVEAGYADVVETGDADVEGLGGEGGLLGDGDVAGAGAEDGDVSDRGGGRGTVGG